MATGINFNCPHEQCQDSLTVEIPDTCSMNIIICPCCRQVVGILNNLVLPLDTQVWKNDDVAAKTEDLREKLWQVINREISLEEVSQISWQDLARIFPEDEEPINEPISAEELNMLDSKTFWEKNN